MEGNPKGFDSGECAWPNGRSLLTDNTGVRREGDCTMPRDVPFAETGFAGCSQDCLLDVTEVADYLRISRSMVYRLIDSGQIPSIRIGRLIRVSKSELAEALSTGRCLLPQGQTACGAYTGGAAKKIQANTVAPAVRAQAAQPPCRKSARTKELRCHERDENDNRRTADEQQRRRPHGRGHRALTCVKFSDAES